MEYGRTEKQHSYIQESCASGNKVSLCFKSRSENVALTRIMAAALVANYDMTLAELDEIKVAVSEAVSNAMIHGYENKNDGWIETDFFLEENVLTIIVHDDGVGIEDIEKAMQPHFSNTEDRMGLGFAFMHSFMDSVDVTSAPQRGTTVLMRKKLRIS